MYGSIQEISSDCTHKETLYLVILNHVEGTGWTSIKKPWTKILIPSAKIEVSRMEFERLKATYLEIPNDFDYVFEATHPIPDQHLEYLNKIKEAKTSQTCVVSGLLAGEETSVICEYREENSEVILTPMFIGVTDVIMADLSGPTGKLERELLN